MGKNKGRKIRGIKRLRSDDSSEDDTLYEQPILVKFLEPVKEDHKME